MPTRRHNADAEPNSPATVPWSFSRGVQPIADTSPSTVSGAACTVS
jgi:hypothetical protein